MTLIGMFIFLLICAQPCIARGAGIFWVLDIPAVSKGSRCTNFEREGLLGDHGYRQWKVNMVFRSLL